MIQPFNPAQTILYWFGDSIPSPQVPPSYAGLISDPVLFPQWAGHQSINAAVGGHNFTQQEAIYATHDSQLEAEAANGKFVLVTYAVGGNDMTNSKPPETLLGELSNHSAYLRGKGIKTVCTTVLPRSYAEGAQAFQRFNELLMQSSGLFDYVIDFSSRADDPFNVAQYPDGVHPAASVHQDLAKAWDIGVRLGLQPSQRQRYIRTTSVNDVGLRISGKAGGQTAHLQTWEIGVGPASYIDGLGHFYGRSINALVGGYNLSSGGTFGPLSSMSLFGTGVFLDNVSAKIVFKTSASEQWTILNTGDLVPLKPNDIGSTTAPVQRVYSEAITLGGVDLMQTIVDLQARLSALEQGCA